MERLKSQFIGSLVGTALGDSLGEGRGRYTDDTAMTIGVAESLIASRGFDADHMAQTFARNYATEPWRGYGYGPPMIFKMMRDGIAWRDAAQRLYPGGSFGNGSAMRVAPVGLLFSDDLSKVAEVARQSSRVTHTHPLGTDGAALQACAVALAVQSQPDTLDRDAFLDALSECVREDIYQEKLLAMGRLLQQNAPMDDAVGELGNTIEAFNSVPIAVYSFLAAGSFEEAVGNALAAGGDRDTIGAMTGAVAGAYSGVERIPETWKRDLENRATIEGLGEQLWQLKESL
ncbi:MAG: ADP-ribosylglycohydrolase family protein [Planctomycetota bacterium]|jgi:poly(ADP-ribose) glycohydrolase ARH3